MKTKIASRIAIVATFAVGISLQACGGAGPDGQSTEPTETSAQDLSILGVNVPQPTVSVSVGDKTATIDPIGTIDKLLPDAGIQIPDPLTPVNQLIGALDNGVSVGLSAPGVEIGATIGLPIPIPQLPNPWADAGGITIIGK